MKSLKELFSSDDGALLIREVIDKTIERASRANAIGRQLCKVLRLTSGPALTINKIGTGNAYIVPELGEVPRDVSSYSKITITPFKIGKSFVVSSEAVEDSQWDVIRLQASESAEDVTQKEDTEIMNVLAATTNTVAMSGSDAVYQDIINLRTAVNQHDGMRADYIAMNPIDVADLEKDLVTKGYRAFDQTAKDGVIGTVGGLKLLQTTKVAEKSFMVLDSRKACYLVIRRPLKTQNFNDPERDLAAGVVMTERIGILLADSNACAKATE
jgi:HK97 family phage major capsid protein